MYPQTVALPDQIQQALYSDIPELYNSEKICICGIGASSLAGDIVSDYIDSVSSKPVSVVRGISLPKWVDENTLVIVVSYSGNTYETNYLYDEAKKRNSFMVSITAGGKLYEKSLADGIPVLEIPQGLQSRSSIGYMVGYIAAILNSIGFPHILEDFANATENLKKYREEILTEGDTTVTTIANAMFEKIPVIYCLASSKSVAVRWKTQLNENAKMISFYGSIPEFNHNEIIGWTEDIDHNRLFLPVIIYDNSASKLLKVMTDASLGILSEKEIKIPQFGVEGKNSFEKNLKGIFVGDLVSLCLAHLRSENPHSNEAVDDTKIITDTE